MRILAGATIFVRRVVDLVLLAVIVVVLMAVAVGKGAPFVGRQTIVIGGASMEPAIPLGSAIVVARADPAALAVGDIVAMQIATAHATFTHRIVAIVDRSDGRWIRTKGDANADPDPTLVSVRAVVGRVELAIPLLGYVVALLSLPLGALFVLGLATTLLAIAWLLESLEPKKRDVATTAPDTVPGAGVNPGPEAADLTASRGEPIAAGPARMGFRTHGLTAAFAGSRAAAIGSSVARPTAREQLGRSREVRNRRARWQRGRGEPPDAG